MIRCSQDFLLAMKHNIKQIYLKFEFYDNKMNFIDSFEKQIIKDDIGSISVDTNRDIRRSFTFSLSNIDNRFDFGSNKLIWLNKRIKLYTGLKLFNGSIEYVPQGVYILTQPQQQNNIDGRKTTISAMDKAFLYTEKRGKFLTQTKIEEGASVTTAIKLIAKDEVLFNFEPNIDTVVPYELTYEPQDNKWNAIKELAELAQCVIYYDVNGYLTLKKINLNDFQNYSPVWSFNCDDEDEKFYAGSVRVLDEEILANRIITLGGSGQTAVARYELVVDENDPLWVNSPYSIQQIGDILYFHNNGAPDGLLTTDDECKWRCKWELMKRLGYTERISVDIAPFYLFEGGDIIYIKDSKNGLDSKYMINSFILPLRPDIMRLECRKENRVIDDWDFI